MFNAQYLNFIEVAQAEYFRNIGMRLYSDEMRGEFDLATVKATLEYLSPVRVDDMLDVCVRVTRMGNSSITFNTEIYLAGSDDLCTHAEVIYANFDADTGVTRRIPDHIREAIREFETNGG